MNCNIKSAPWPPTFPSRLYRLPESTPKNFNESLLLQTGYIQEIYTKKPWPSLTSPKANATFCQDRLRDPKIQRTGSSPER